MHTWIKKLLYVSILTILMMIIIGCTNEKNKEKDSNNNNGEQVEGKDTEDVDENTNPLLHEVVLTVDNEDVSYSEVILYFKYIESYYESIFGEHIWSYDLGGMSIGDLAKQDIIDTIVERKITKKQWTNYEILITEDDESRIKSDVENYLRQLTQEDIDYYGITEEVAYQFFFDNMIAERVYDAATMSVDTDVSDEEAKQITIQYLLIRTNEEDGIAYAKAQDLLNQAVSAEDFYSFAKSNTDAPQVEVTIGKGDMNDEFESAAFELKTGEFSNIIESDDGYLILYCVDDFNEDGTLEKKEEIIDERQSEVFQNLYNEWQADVKVKLDEDIWEQMEFK